MGKHYPKIQCSMTIAALSFFGAQTKIALTGVHSRVRESLANGSSNNFKSVLFTEIYLFPFKKCFPTLYKIKEAKLYSFETVTYL